MTANNQMGKIIAKRMFCQLKCSTTIHDFKIYPGSPQCNSRWHTVNILNVWYRRSNSFCTSVVIIILSPSWSLHRPLHLTLLKSFRVIKVLRIVKYVEITNETNTIPNNPVSTRQNNCLKSIYRPTAMALFSDD